MLTCNLANEVLLLYLSDVQIGFWNVYSRWMVLDKLEILSINKYICRMCYDFLLSKWVTIFGTFGVTHIY